MGSIKILVVVAIGSLLALAVPAPAQSQDTAQSGVQNQTENAEPSVSFLIIQTLPYSTLNTIPGFGLGSFLQEQTRSAWRLALADTLAWGLLAPGIILSSRSLREGAEGGDEAGGLALAAGFAVYAGTRVAGLGAPFFAAFKYGQDPQRLMAPVFYNMLPGFGLGSLLQGDMKSARLLRILDLATLGALGFLSGFALSGDDIPAAASVILFFGLFGTSKLGGVILPHRYRDAYSSH